jgi:hypothetical protein
LIGNPVPLSACKLVEKIGAEFKDGVLSVTLLKVQEAKPRTIQADKARPSRPRADNRQVQCV